MAETGEWPEALDEPTDHRTGIISDIPKGDRIGVLVYVGFSRAHPATLLVD